MARRLDHAAVVEPLTWIVVGLLAAPSVAQALQCYQAARLERTGRIVAEAHANRGLFHLETIEQLKAAFAGRDMDRERSDWLYAYNPLTVDLRI